MNAVFRDLEARRNLPDWACGPYSVQDAGNRAARPYLLSAVEKDQLDQITLKAIREFNRRTEGIVEHWRDIARGPERDKMKASWVLRRAQGRERVAWWQQQMAAIKADQARAGIPELEAAFERLSDRETALEQAIHDASAQTSAGIAVKLRLALRLQGNLAEYFDWPEQIILSAQRDAEQMAKADQS